MNLSDVVAAWNVADSKSIHPTRTISEAAYWESGKTQAKQLAVVLKPRSVVVDFGCGDGRVAISMRQLGFQMIGVDSSSNMLQVLNVEDPDLQTIESDGHDLFDKLDGQRVDALYCLAVLIHHGYADGAQIVGQLRDIVRPGGLLILDWPVSDTPVERQTWTSVTTWSMSAQQDLTDRLGLTRVDRDVPWPVFQVR